jgi:hypothetical protein
MTLLPLLFKSAALITSRTVVHVQPSDRDRDRTYRRQFFRTVEGVLTASNRHYGRTFLEKNFCPVTTEVFREQLTVEGKLPGTLRGAFLRIGPNPFLKPLGGYHW